MDEIKLIKIKHPFNRQQRTEEIIDYNHENLQVIKDTYFPKDMDVVVSVKGGVVPEKDLALVTLKHGDAVVFMPSVEGGGDDIFRAVASLALVAVAIWAPYALGMTTSVLTGVYGGGAYAVGTFATGLTLGGALLSAGIMMAGGFLINSLLPAPVADVDAYSGSSFDNSNIYAWNPVTKQQQGLVIPKYYGTIPVYGNIISTYTENEAEKNYLNVLLHVGQGPINSLSDYYINDQPLYKENGLTGIKTYTKLGHINQSAVENFNDTKTEYTMNVNCAYNVAYTYATIGSAFDGLEVDITFPRGLYYVRNDSTLADVSVDLRIEIKKQGESDWTPITSKTVSVGYTVDASYWEYGYWQNQYDGYGSINSRTWVPCGTGSSVITDHEEEEFYGRTTITDSYGFTGSEVYLVWHWIPATGIAYSDTTAWYTTVTDHVNSPIVKTFKSEMNLPHGTYDVKVTRLTVDYLDTRYGALTHLTAVREVVRDDFSYPCSALVGIKALATDQLSGSFKFKCTEEGALIRYYDGSDWHVGFNNNPAWVCYDVLTQPLFDDPDEVIDPTDGLNYRCIVDVSGTTEPHSDAVHWQQGGDQGVAWSSGTSYTAWSATALRYDGIATSRLDTTTFKAWADWCDTLVLSGKDDTDLISTASEVIGTDGLNYSCILNHTSTTDDRPITGANYATYWSQTGTGGGSWQASKDYKSNSRTATSSTTTTLTDNTKSWYSNIHRDRVVEITAGTGSGQRRLITSNTDDTLTISPVWTTPLSTDSVYTIREDYERNFTFNGGFDSGTSLWEAALQIAMMSRALLVWDGTTIKVVLDKAVTLATDVTQLFSMSNIYVDSFEETFLSSAERTGEIEINFINKDLDYEKDSITVLNTSLDKPENRNTITLAGTTSQSQAWRMGYFFLKQNELLKRTIKFDADVDAITCTIGDVIYFQHDVPQWGVCGGRVVSSTNNTVTLDQSVTLSGSPTTYSIMVWLSDDTLVTKTVDNSVPGATTTLTISGTWTTNPSEYDRFAFGESDNTAKAFRVIEISRTSDLKCTIRAIEYDDDVYAVDSDTPILPDTTYTTREPIAIVTNLNASEEAQLDELSGASRRSIHVTWAKPVNIYYDHAEVWYASDINTAYTYAGISYTNDFYIPNIVANATYTIKIISVSYVGVKTSELESPTTTVTTSKVVKTDDFSFIGGTLQQRVGGLQLNQLKNTSTFEGKDCVIIWNPTTPIDFGGAGQESTGAGTSAGKAWLKDYEVSVYDSSGTLRRVEYTETPSYIYPYEENVKDSDDGAAVSDFTFEVRARDTTGNTSIKPAILSVSKSTPSDVTGLTATSIVGGVKFEWDKSTDVAWNLYTYRISVNGTFGDWTDTEANSVTKLMSSTEVAALITANESPDTTIAIEVKQKDIYGNESTTEATTSASANAVSANLFQIIGLKSSDGVTGTVSDLYNGTLSSGGVVIT